MHALNTAVVLVAAALFGLALCVPSSEESGEGMGEGPPEELMKVRDACMKELGITETDKKDSKTKDKVLACMFKKDGTMTEDGKFSGEGAIAHAAKTLKDKPEKLANVKMMVAECNRTLSTLKGPEDMVAGRIHRCFHDFHEALRASTTKASA